ncbi:hypothetical protein GCM10009828_060540 [Actinoplanes couchii]|uniref:Uncharacterized protein n=1 Tax=Actinoplanes couchii TaxID=403638 RepID=A0ABQ3XML0_9ACTN|nr:hypothetical protein Aco03nite_081400 [Actinoplanes couchii]
MAPDDEDPHPGIGHLAGPALPQFVARKGVTILREDVGKRPDRTLLLNVENGLQIGRAGVVKQFPSVIHTAILTPRPPAFRPLPAGLSAPAGGVTGAG